MARPLSALKLCAAPEDGGLGISQHGSETVLGCARALSSVLSELLERGQIFTETSLTDYLHSRDFQSRVVIARLLPYLMKSRYPKSPRLLPLYLVLPIQLRAGQMLVVAESLGSVQGLPE